MEQHGAHETFAACEQWYSPVTLLVFSDEMILSLYLALVCSKLRSKLVWCKQLAHICFTIGVLGKMGKANLLMMHVVYQLESKGGPSSKHLWFRVFLLLTYRGVVALSDFKGLMLISHQLWLVFPLSHVTNNGEKLVKQFGHGCMTCYHNFLHALYWCCFWIRTAKQVCIETLRNRVLGAHSVEHIHGCKSNHKVRNMVRDHTRSTDPFRTLVPYLLEGVYHTSVPYLCCIPLCCIGVFYIYIYIPCI